MAAGAQRQGLLKPRRRERQWALLATLARPAAAWPLPRPAHRTHPIAPGPFPLQVAALCLEGRLQELYREGVDPVVRRLMKTALLEGGGGAGQVFTVAGWG